jgi:hypothetical protein
MLRLAAQRSLVATLSIKGSAKDLLSPKEIKT